MRGAGHLDVIPTAARFWGMAAPSRPDVPHHRFAQIAFADQGGESVVARRRVEAPQLLRRVRVTQSPGISSNSFLILNRRLMRSASGPAGDEPGEEESGG